MLDMDISGAKRTLMASMAYSTWKMRPSGEKVFTPRSYSLRVRNMLLVLYGFKTQGRVPSPSSS